MKKWYLSKTLWINLIAIGGIILRAQYDFILSPAEEVAILALINLALRVITKEELELRK